jgi:methylmalonyl-CoA mutase N-terminal domain/subunit
MVGVNAYRLAEEEPYDALYIDESVTGEQLALLRQVRSERDQRKVDDSLQALRNAAQDESANTMPFILDAVRAYATVGEISDALRDVFGTYQEPALF